MRNGKRDHLDRLYAAIADCAAGRTRLARGWAWTLIASLILNLAAPTGLIPVAGAQTGPASSGSPTPTATRTPGNTPTTTPPAAPTATPTPTKAAPTATPTPSTAASPNATSTATPTAT